MVPPEEWTIVSLKRGNACEQSRPVGGKKMRRTVFAVRHTLS